MPGFALAITRADSVAAGPAARGRGAAVNLPAHCRVDGTIDRRTGAEGKPYGIGFAIALPDAWNGRFLFQGGGGLNGTVGLPLGAQAAGDSPALARGFAVVSTDTGHQASGGAFDAAFMRDQQAVLDFEYVGDRTGRRRSRRRSSRGTTGGPPTARILRAARRAGAKPC